MIDEIKNHEKPGKNTAETDNNRLETLKLVRLAVTQLPGALRQTIMLVDRQGYSYIETADILSIPVGTVASRLSRARSSLRDQLASLSDR